MDPIVVSANEAARCLRIRTNEIYHKLESGEIPGYKEGRNWKIPARLLEEYVIERAMRESDIRQEIEHESDN